MSIIDIDRYLERCALDESLAEHDKKYHLDGYKEGDKCNKRETMAGGDGVDKVKVEGQGQQRNGSSSDRGNGVTAEEDAAYLDAVKRGNKETARRMVREVAEKNGYSEKSTTDTLKEIGIDKSNFDVFSTFARLSVTYDGYYNVSGKTIESKRFNNLKDAVRYLSENGFDGRMSKGPYDQDFSSLPEDSSMVRKYASPTYTFYHKTSDQIYRYLEDKKARDTSDGDPVFIRFGKIPKGGRSKNYVEGNFEQGISVFEGLRLRDGTVFVIPKTNQQLGTLLHLREQGRKVYIATGDVNGTGSDGELTLSDAKLVEAKEYTFSPPKFFVNGKSVKSADPVTYDDAGQPIPLSRRFDFSSDDIRH